MLKRNPQWVHSIVDDICLQSGSMVIPCIRVNKAYLDSELDLGEFEQTLKESLKPPSQGVILWSWERVAQDPEKLEMLKDIL